MKSRSEDRKSPFPPEKVKFAIRNTQILKIYYVVGFLVKIQKKSDSTHSSSNGGAYFLTGLFSKKTRLFEAVVLVG